MEHNTIIYKNYLLILFLQAFDHVLRHNVQVVKHPLQLSGGEGWRQCLPQLLPLLTMGIEDSKVLSSKVSVIYKIHGGSPKQKTC